MKKMLSLCLALLLMLGAVSALAGEPAQAGASNFMSVTDENGNVYDLFEIRRLVLDENQKVIAVTGCFERTGTDEDGMDSPFFTGEPVTCPMAKDAVIEVFPLDDPMGDYETVTDLYQWYVGAYLNGEAPENGELRYAEDIPADQADTVSPDFWFITTRIALNEAGEITHLQTVYVPWQ